MIDRLEEIWLELEAGPSDDDDSAKRIYRRLELRRESGVRLGFVLPDRIREMLVHVGEQGQHVDVTMPQWKGMACEVITLDVPENGSIHLRLFLKRPEHEAVFTALCADLARGLDDCTSSEGRRKEVEACLARWSRFFERHGYEGLTPERQRGLFGELWWLKRNLESAIDMLASISSWKGCERNFHDFEMQGHVVEVKTTMTKEPRKIRISNERQLDDRGLKSLHLFVLTLLQTEGSEMTLPDLITLIRKHVGVKPAAKSSFERGLQAAGYLDIHSSLYTASYIVKKEELFVVKDNFPRLIEVPAGVGDIRYSVIMVACADFETSMEAYLRLFT